MQTKAMVLKYNPFNTFISIMPLNDMTLSKQRELFDGEMQIGITQLSYLCN